MEPIIDISKLNQPEENKVEVKIDKKNYLPIITTLLFIGSFVIISFIIYINAYLPPSDFKSGTIIHIKNGDSVASITTELYDNKIISSELFFTLLVKGFKVGTKIQQGDYLFDKSEDAYKVMTRIVNADYGIDEQKILIREGLSRKEMAVIFAKSLPLFNTDEFLNISKDNEGLLFPDTYVFFKTATSGEVVYQMKENFDTKTSELKARALGMSKDWDSIIKIASLVELEGKTKEDREMIADIIYRRLEKNMPLQLDATFQYYLNKGSLQLTQDDLFSESPYNSYRNKGLPPTPIASPGIESIEAAMYPKENNYLYYLSDKDGVVHYADTFDKHKQNKKIYLSK